MSGENISDERPQATTPRDDAELHISLSTAAHLEPPTPAVISAELRQDVTQGKSDNRNILMESTSSLDKLQTYLPTGTWLMYTALQTWAFSLSPGATPTSPISNCNRHQRIALIIVLCLSTSFAFLSSFVKRFVYDSNNIHVLHPAPNYFSVARQFTDPITGVTFPCRTEEKRYCWPLINEMGEVKYDDEKGVRLRVLVFKPGVKVHVRRKTWFKRIWNSCFNPEEVLTAPRLGTPLSKQLSLYGNTTRPEERIVTCDIDGVVARASLLEPRWKHTVMGSSGSKAYLDLSLSVWAHALVSVLAFCTLALFSTQVTGCIYPSVPDYLPPTVQTGMLIILSLIAALFIGDDAVSLGQSMPRGVPISSHGGEAEVPAHLREVFDMVVWISRQHIQAK